jgi:ataxia telangiectasia mutated family protein
MTILTFYATILYSWSVSPLRLKRMQEAQNDAPAPTTGDAAVAEMSRKKENNEPGEADRALTVVVAKKLSKSPVLRPR